MPFDQPHTSHWEIIDIPLVNPLNMHWGWFPHDPRWFTMVAHSFPNGSPICLDGSQMIRMHSLCWTIDLPSTNNIPIPDTPFDQPHTNHSENMDNPLVNQTIDKTISNSAANHWQTSGKPLRNLWQTMGKHAANHGQPCGKPLTNLCQSIGQPVVNYWPTNDTQYRCMIACILFCDQFMIDCLLIDKWFLHDCLLIGYWLIIACSLFDYCIMCACFLIHYWLVIDWLLTAYCLGVHWFLIVCLLIDWLLTAYCLGVYWFLTDHWSVTVCFPTVSHLSSQWFTNVSQYFPMVS